MKLAELTTRIDTAIRFFLYLLIFWLPYSKAIIEISVIAGSLLWIVKRGLIFADKWRKKRGSKSFGAEFLKAFALPESSLNPAIALFLMACIISIFASVAPLQSLKGFINKTLEWFAIYFLALEVFTNRRHMSWALGIFGVTALATGIDTLLQFYWLQHDIFDERPLIEGYRATAAFWHPNMLGAFLTIATPLALFFFQKKKSSPAIKVLFFINLIVLIWALLLTYSRGAWAATFLALLFYFTAQIWPKADRRLKIWSVIFILIAIPLMLFQSFELKKSFNTGGNDIGTLNWRVVLWKESVSLVKERPFWGHGVNTYMRVMDAHVHAGPNPLVADFRASYAHNCYLQIAVETGILGFAAFIGIIIMLFRELFFKGDLLQKALLAGLLAFLLHSFVDTNFYTLQLPALFWMFAGVGVARAKMLSNS